MVKDVDFDAEIEIVGSDYVITLNDLLKYELDYDSLMDIFEKVAEVILDFNNKDVH